MVQWRSFTCPNCDGRGLVISSNSFDRNEIVECSDCGGSGQLWVTDKDIVAMYPGGPFRGKWPGQYKEAKLNCLVM